LGEAKETTAGLKEKKTGSQTKHMGFAKREEKDTKRGAKDYPHWQKKKHGNRNTLWPRKSQTGVNGGGGGRGQRKKGERTIGMEMELTGNQKGRRTNVKKRGASPNPHHF